MPIMSSEAFEMAATAEQVPTPRPNFAQPAKVHQAPEKEAPRTEERTLVDVCRDLMKASLDPSAWQKLPRKGSPPFLSWQAVVNMLHKHAGDWEAKTIRVEYNGDGSNEEVVVTVRLTIMGVSRDGSKAENLRAVSRDTGQEFDRPAVETAERRALVRAATYFGIADKPKGQ